MKAEYPEVCVGLSISSEKEKEPSLLSRSVSCTGTSNLIGVYQGRASSLCWPALCLPPSLLTKSPVVMLSTKIALWKGLLPFLQVEPCTTLQTTADCFHCKETVNQPVHLLLHACIHVSLISAHYYITFTTTCVHLSFLTSSKNKNALNITVIYRCGLFLRTTC